MSLRPQRLAWDERGRLLIIEAGVDLLALLEFGLTKMADMALDWRS